MHKADFLRMIAAEEEAEYSPVAGMLTSGYGFAGYFNGRLNAGLDETCVLINARLVDLRAPEGPASRPRVADFNQFIEEIVQQSYQSEEPVQAPRRDFFGRSIPLAGIPFDQVAVVYPVNQIGKMMKALHSERHATPTFLDFENKSVVLRLLLAKLW